MKKMMFIALTLTLFMLILPIGVLGKETKALTDVVVKSEKNDVQTIQAVKNDTFRVLDKVTGKVTEMSAQSYIFGVVAAEMPALYEVEALKAQAVTAYTFACYKREQNKEKEYDISTDFTTDQSFKTEEQALKDWGEKGSEYAEKIKNAINTVSGEMLTYNGKPILAVYHALSCGQTYSAKEVWGSEIPYLQSVPSAGDKLAENYISVLEFTEEELKTKLSALFPEDTKKQAILGETVSANSGLVKTLELFGKEVAGSEIREKLGLSSSNFKYEKNEDKYLFTSYGYGHGVGMSQKGADYMAKQGYSYKEILKHYYTGVQIGTVN